jgi:hypothetical protein
VAETPGRKGDRGQMRLQMARRQVDDQPADMALVHRRQLCRDKFENSPQYARHDTGVPSSSPQLLSVQPRLPEYVGPPALVDIARQNEQ